TPGAGKHHRSARNGTRYRCHAASVNIAFARGRVSTMAPVLAREEPMKRVVLFLLTNLAVLVVLSVVTNLLGLNRALAENGLNLGALLVFSAIIGFGGAFISLLMSKTIARWSTGAQVISEPRSENETWLLATVKKLADRAGVAMPEVAIYEGEPNAFATGAVKNCALVAVPPRSL